MRDIWLRRWRKTHEIKCYHEEIEYVWRETPSLIMEMCSLCGVLIKPIGWDDLPSDARQVLLDALAEDKNEEETY